MAAPSATWGECPPMRPTIVGNSRTMPGEQYTWPCRLRVEALCLGSVPLELHTNCVPLSGGDVLICPRAFIWGQVVLKVVVCCLVNSVMSNSLRPNELQSARLLCW